MQYLVHVANLLYLLSYLVRDILWLRLLTVVAATSLMPYFYFQSPPLMAPIYWNLVFLAINVYQIQRLILERRPVRLTEPELELYMAAFRSLTRREFAKLLSIGRWEDAADGTRLVCRGTPLDKLCVIHAGSANIVLGSGTMELGVGRFIGEMSFVSGEAPTAEVTAKEGFRCLSWRTPELQALLERESSLRASLQMLLSTELCAKLRGAECIQAG